MGSPPLLVVIPRGPSPAPVPGPSAPTELQFEPGSQNNPFLLLLFHKRSNFGAPQGQRGPCKEARCWTQIRGNRGNPVPGESGTRIKEKSGESGTGGIRFRGNPGPGESRTGGIRDRGNLGPGECCISRFEVVVIPSHVVPPRSSPRPQRPHRTPIRTWLPKQQGSLIAFP